MHRLRHALAALAALLLAAPAAAETLRIDPSGGGDHPSLAAALAAGAVAAGDAVTLAPGWHGALDLDGERLAPGPAAAPVTLRAEAGAEAGRLRISGGRGRWVVEGLTLRPGAGGPPPGGWFARLSPESSGSVLRGLVIDGAPGVAPESAAWSREDWRTRARNGVVIAGAGHLLEGTALRNLYHAAVAAGPDNTLRGLRIAGFGGDGVRALGDRTVVEDSEIRDCVHFDSNHDDGIQSWSRGADGPGTGVARGIVLRRNVIIERTAPHPFGCLLQGIGFFDGFFEDLTIENNIVRVGHPHGITVMGARRARIVNNTVPGPARTGVGGPWITITEHKDGRPSVNSLIAGNVTASLNFDGFDREKRRTDAEHVRLLGNVVVEDAAQALVDPPRDLRPLAGGPAHDPGGAWPAPERDIFGAPRVGPPDAGAIERQEG